MLQALINAKNCRMPPEVCDASTPLVSAQVGQEVDNSADWEWNGWDINDDSEDDNVVFKDNARRQTNYLTQGEMSRLIMNSIALDSAETSQECDETSDTCKHVDVDLEHTTASEFAKIIEDHRNDHRIDPDEVHEFLKTFCAVHERKRFAEIEVSELKAKNSEYVQKFNELNEIIHERKRFAEIE